MVSCLRRTVYQPPWKSPAHSNTKALGSPMGWDFCPWLSHIRVMKELLLPNTWFLVDTLENRAATEGDSEPGN